MIRGLQDGTGPGKAKPRSLESTYRVVLPHHGVPTLIKGWLPHRQGTAGTERDQVWVAEE
jgi:hypothetical protein